MVNERSAGAIIFRREGKDIKYLLLHYKYKSDYWEFSRGNIEKGESEEQAAKREISEETGIEDLEFIPNFQKKLNWFYTRDNKLIHKEVTFFLAETKRQEVKISEEHVGYGWFTFDNALKKLSFVNSKEALNEANRFLSENFPVSD